MSRSSVPEPVTAVTDRAGAWLPERLAAVERRLAEVAGTHGSVLGEDAGSTLAAGGKRMRPLLVLLCAGPEGGPDALRAATAIELVHMATLVHDDVIDAAPLRRGVPTVVARAGRGRALATGDLLFSRAFAELAACSTPAPVALMARAAVDLARGELAQRHDAFDASIDQERYLYRCRLKTAALFECACLIGRPGQPGSEALTAYGRAIGIAFQLLDDVLDVVGPPERTGKARGTDLLDGTVTMPFILARARDGSLGSLDLGALEPAAAERVCDAIEATGATDQVRADARRRVAEAKEALAAAPIDAEARRLFDLVADGVVERYS